MGHYVILLRDKDVRGKVTPSATVGYPWQGYGVCTGRALRPVSTLPAPGIPSGGGLPQAAEGGVFELPDINIASPIELFAALRRFIQSSLVA